MANLIDKLITRVDLVRQRAADKFGLPAHNMYRVLRTWSGTQIGDGSPTDLETLMTPTPRIKFYRQNEGWRLDPNGLTEDRRMRATEISLTFQEDFLQGEPRAANQECFYKLVERNGQGADTTYWILAAVPLVVRDEVFWQLDFKPYTVC